jgi:hypothetical protein
VAVEGGVMELAEGHAVAHHRVPLGMAIGRDVSGVQQFLVPEAAQCASLLVSTQHPFAERLLMETLANGPRHVLAPSLDAILADLRGRVRVRGRDVVYLDGKPQADWIVADNERRIGGDI